jgi:hypothetical protein
MQQEPKKKAGFFGKFINLFKKKETDKLASQNKIPSKVQKKMPLPNLMMGGGVTNPGSAQPSTGEKFRQKVDTNVFQVSMACLKETYEIATGDLIECKNCKGILNFFSLVIGRIFSVFLIELFPCAQILLLKVL